MKISFIGLGNMGVPMARNLLKRGHALKVHDVAAERVKQLVAEGCVASTSAIDCAKGAEAVITMLPSSPHVRAVYGGDYGVLAGSAPGMLLIDCSTIDPITAREVEMDARAKGCAMVDAPVSGGVGGAEAGTLTFMVGGEVADFERAKPLLEQMCRRVDLVGPVGAGTSLKLALNLPLLVYYQALAEAYVLCRHLKLDNKWLMEFLSETSGGPNMLKTRGPAIAAALDGKDPGLANFDIELVCKDLATMVAEAKARGATLPLAEQALAVYAEALKQGWGTRDGAWLPAYWPNRG